MRRRANKWQQICRYFPSRVVLVGCGYMWLLRARVWIGRRLRIYTGRTGREWAQASTDKIEDGWEVVCVVRR